MADQVVQLLADERELAADLSHRLRTPLTVLRLNAGLARGPRPAAQQTRAASRSWSARSTSIIRTARRPSRRRRRSPAPGATRPRWSGSGWPSGPRSRRTRAASGSWPARARRSASRCARAELAAALDALLGNVFRHTPEGTAFAVDLHNGADAVIVLVSDAGPGIPDPEAALRRGASGAGSTGLGLDIVRQLAESTGGAMRIDASSLGGARVQLWFRTDQRDPTPRATRRLVGNRWSRKKATR